MDKFPDHDAETQIVNLRKQQGASGGTAQQRGSDLASERIVGEIKEIAINQIEPNPEQPRKSFNERDLRSLAASIAQDGVLQPLIVMPSKQRPGGYILVAGERRLRASKLAGLSTVPVYVKETRLDDRLRLALIENIQRSDLNVVEEAQAYLSLINEYGLSQDQCAAKVGKDRSTITNYLRLLNLPSEIQDDLINNRLTMAHAKALLGLEDKYLVLQVRDLILRKQLNSKKTERLCKSLKQKQKKAGLGVRDINDVHTTLEGAAALPGPEDADLEYMAESMRNYLHTRVKISGDSRRGRIEINYFSAAELERIIALICKSE